MKISRCENVKIAEETFNSNKTTFLNLHIFTSANLHIISVPVLQPLYYSI